MIKRILFASAVPAVLGAPLAAQTEIEFWHAFTGRLGELVDEQVATFNASQSDYKVVASHKGNYSETLNAGIAAFRAGEQPDILMVFEVGTATMMAAPGAIKPVYRGDGRRRRAISTRTPISARSKATTPPPTARCCRCPSTPRPRCSGSTATR